MIRDQRCPNHQCGKLAFKIEDGAVKYKCRGCKTILSFPIRAMTTAWSTLVR